MVYGSTLIKSQIMMRWKLILKDFVLNIKDISRVDNILAYILTRITTSTENNFETSTIRSICYAKELFVTRQEYTKNISLPLDLSLI